MKAKLLKYIVGAFIVDENDNGEIIAVHEVEFAECFGRDALMARLETIDELINSRTVDDKP